MNQLKSIDLFAGIGGIRLGFENAFGDKIKTVFASEWDSHAQKTYQANFVDGFEISGDITQIPEVDIPAFDICLAGFPCQAFSMAGAKKGFNDDYKGMARGTLFFDVVRICALHKPKVIFCENVKGLTIHDRGNTFKTIIGAFTEIGYTPFDEILNSRDFGVPQNRERIYIVAFRNDIDSSNFKFPKPTDSSKVLEDIIEKIPVCARYYLSEKYVDTLRKHRERHEAKGHGFGYEIRDWNGVAGAIVCGGMGRERNLLIDKRQTDLRPVTNVKGEINKEGIRKMTPREWARLQGFPDSFKLPLADVHLYKQLGNSVTVSVIEEIAKKIKLVLEQNHKGVKNMAMTGNKGEWSEVYAFLRLLADGKLYAADERLNRIHDMFFPIIKIIREETRGTAYEYFPNHQSMEVEIYLDDERVLTLPVRDFENHANRLLADINIGSLGTRSFEVPYTEAFIRGIFICKPKAKTSNTADINIQLHDVNTGYEQVVGFSIKSKLGEPPHLLNAGKTTNFTFRVDGLALQDISEINAINTRNKIIDRMRAISDKSGTLHFHEMENAVFEENLMMIDSQMPTIVAKMLEGHYAEIASDVKSLTSYVIRTDPLSRSSEFYKHKIKELLCAVALGMKPATRWDGTDEATGGYIIVKTDGDVLAYHIYNRDSFKGYLLNNTKFERGSTSKHGFATLYEQDGQIYIKLNFAIRFQ